MIINIAQTIPVKGNLEKNLAGHLRFIEIAVSRDADLIVFPELSLTGYEPALASELATNQNDKRLDILQEVSDNKKIWIAAGLPTRKDKDIFISLVFFRPGQERFTYSKQFLYPTERGIFSQGKEQFCFCPDGKTIIAPAICYELSVPEHSMNAHLNNADIYIASVLNSVSGVDNDIRRLSEIACKYGMTTFMANYAGLSGGYECAGKSSVWNKKGELLAQLDDTSEGILLYDTETEKSDCIIIQQAANN
jgi:predicted amidohydrolase